MTQNKRIATALKFDRHEDDVPRLIAKGMGLVAENIVEKASEHDIPVYRDARLSRQLSSLSLGEEIPEALYGVVAEVLVFIAKLDQGD